MFFNVMNEMPGMEDMRKEWKEVWELWRDGPVVGEKKTEGEEG